MTGTILIVDDVATNRIVLKVQLAAACYSTLQAATAEEALDIAERLRPQLILMDADLPGMSGLEACRALRANPATCDIPQIMVTAARDCATRRAALGAGADDFLSRPVNEAMLLARIRSLLRARELEDSLRLGEAGSRAMGLAEPEAGFAPAGTVALVAGRAETAMAWRRALAPHLRDHMVVMTREAALRDSGPAPDLFLIAADLAGRGDGLLLMSELRSRPGTRHAAICIVLPDQAGEMAAFALDLGASDLLPAAFDPLETALRLQAQLRRKQHGDRLRASVRDGLREAVTDPLTGLHNRRFALPQADRIAARAAAAGQPYAVLVLDIDRFKSINDTLGHAAGDAVLIEVARRLRSQLRPGDLLARIGGEEFLVVLPDTSAAPAHRLAERLRRVIAAAPFDLSPFDPAAPPLPVDAGALDAGAPGPVSLTLPHAPPEAVAVTVSIGLASGCPAPGAAPRLAEVMLQADHALLAAKAGGRNRVTLADRAA